jgi:hypothetical protein
LSLGFQLSEVFISAQLSAPTQAHRRSPSGVSKQLKFAHAAECVRSDAATMVSTRRAFRISPSITLEVFNYQRVSERNVLEGKKAPVAADAL